MTALPIRLLFVVSVLAGCTGSIPGGSSAKSVAGGKTASGGQGGAGGKVATGDKGGDSSSPAGPGNSSPVMAPPVDPSTGTFFVPRTGMRRLSRAELDATLRDLLLDETHPASVNFSEENISVFFGFDNDATANLESSQAYIESLESVITDATRAALRDPAKRARIVPCTPTGPGDAACMKRFVATFGRLALRRTLDDDEQKLFEAFASYALEAGDFYRGVEGAIRAMLTSPPFIYRMEFGVPVKGSPDLFQLTPQELASRLAYFLLGTTPDGTLLDAADQGKLNTPEQVRAIAQILIADPRARERVHHFVSYWLGYAGGLPPDLAPFLEEESNTLIDDVVFDSPRDFHALFLSDRTFIGDRLRMHYADIGAPPIGKSDWVPYGKSPRRGILSHSSVLSAFKTGEDTSPTKRGRFIRMHLLCDVIPDPPPNVAVDVTASNTQCKTGPNGFFTLSHKGASCQACHDQMDPIGFGLERYDVRGKFRTTDTGKPNCPIDGQGTVLTSVNGASKSLPFNGPGQLGQLLIDSGKLDRCVVQHLYRFAVGRREDPADDKFIDQLHDKFQNGQRNFAALLVDLASDPAFAYRRQSTN